MTALQNFFKTPVARLIGGSLYQLRTTNSKGEPLTYKDGSPRGEYQFRFAIKKGAEAHWNQTPWGAVIWKTGVDAFAHIANSPVFAWKVINGDSEIPDTKGIRPIDRPHYAGHWVIRFAPSQKVPFDIVDKSGRHQLLEKNLINLGDFVQIYAEVRPNSTPGTRDVTPGVYLNPVYVSFQGYGERIETAPIAPPADSIGFGQDPLPAGCSSVPIAGTFNPAPPVAQPPMAAAPTPAPAGMPPVPVTPHTGILTPPAPVGRTMLPKAGGFTYEQFMATGQWTDELLIRDGYMLP